MFILHYDCCAAKAMYSHVSHLCMAECLFDIAGQKKKKRPFPQRGPRTVSILGILGQLIVSELRIYPLVCPR
jgi:hypothetical protein